VEAVSERYLAPLFKPEEERGRPPDCLVLGCTHFPPLLPVIRKVVGEAVRVVDSAETTARVVQEALRGMRAMNPQSGRGSRAFLTTDDVARFASIGSIFLGDALAEEEVELVNL
jgi:glutamate racemase